MSVWAWVGIGFGALLFVSVVVGHALAAILGQISREVSELLDLEPWASEPLARARRERITSHSLDYVGEREKRR